MDEWLAGLPLLLRAAAALALGAATEIPWGIRFALVALACFSGVDSAVVVPFFLAGALARGEVPRFQVARPATLPVVATVASRATERGQWVTPIRFATAEGRRAAGDGGALLIESGDAPPHAAGSALLASGTLYPAGPPRNPGALGEGARMRADRVVAEVGGTGAFETCRDRIVASFDRLAQAAERRLADRLPPDASALAAALSLGRAGGLAPPFVADLKAIGAWHFLAVSGSHLLFVAAVVSWLAARATKRAALQDLGGALLVTFFALLSGSQTPALRALVSFLGSLLALRSGRPASSGAWLAAALLLLAVATPEALDDAGLELSFLAVVALGVAARYAPAKSPRGTGTGIRFRVPLLRALRYALAAGIATAPLTALRFGTIAWLAPAATLLLGPVMGAALGLSLLALVTTLLPPFATHWLGLPLDGCAALLRWLAKRGASLPHVPWIVPAPTATGVLLLAASWLLLLARRPLLALGAIAAAGFLEFGPLSDRAASASESRRSELLLLDVGHGQAALAFTDGRCDLFDCGGDSGFGADDLERALAARQVARIDALFLSHLDADHAGLVPELLGIVPVGTIVISSAARREVFDSSAPRLVQSIRDKAAARGVAITPLHRGEQLGPYRCLWPPPEREFSARNDGCLALTRGAGVGSWLLPGDLEGMPLIEMAQGIVAPIELLLLPHHGNRDPAVAALVRRCRPLLAFASRSDPELPPETRAALATVGSAWLGTMRGGAIALAHTDPTADCGREPGTRVARGGDR